VKLAKRLISATKQMPLVLRSMTWPALILHAPA